MALRPVMDASKAELLKLIYTKIGVIMEDASVIALELGGQRGPLDQANAAKLQNSVHELSALASAARALSE